MAEHLTRAERRAASAARILDAAQIEFGAHGADGATIRGIARRAGVDPSLVLQHYGSKQGLFALAVRPIDDVEPDDLRGHLAEILGARLADLPPATRALMRSMLTSPEAAAVMRDYVNERALALTRAMTGDDARLRAAVVVSSILGVTIARHFLELPALADADAAQSAAVIERWLAPLTTSASG